MLTRSQRYSNPIPMVGAFSKETAFEYIRTLHPTARELLNLLIWYRSKNKFVCPSQEKIAQHLGISRMQVNRIISKLVKDGVIGKYYRHCKSSYYNINILLFAHKDRYLMQQYIPNIYLLGKVEGVMVSPRTPNKKLPFVGLFLPRHATDVTQTILKEAYIINLFKRQAAAYNISLLNRIRATLKRAMNVARSWSRTDILGNASSVSTVPAAALKINMPDESMYRHSHNSNENEPRSIKSIGQCIESSNRLSSIVDDPSTYKSVSNTGSQVGTSYDKVSMVVDAPMDKLAQFEMLKAQLTQESIEMAKRKVMGVYGDVYS